MQPLQIGSGSTFRSGQESWCLPYAGFFICALFNIFYEVYHFFKNNVDITLNLKGPFKYDVREQGRGEVWTPFLLLISLLITGWQGVYYGSKLEGTTKLQVAKDWAIETLYGSHYYQLSWPALDKGKVLNQSSASTRESENSWPRLWPPYFLRRLTWSPDETMRLSKHSWSGPPIFTDIICKPPLILLTIYGQCQTSLIEKL